MTSRLHWTYQVILLLIISFLSSGSQLRAQEYFSFSYGGPDTIFVGNDCTAPYTFHGDSIHILSLVNANVSWDYDYATAGYEYGDLVQAGQTVSMPVPTWDDQSHADTFYFDIYFADTLSPVFDASSLPPPVLFFNNLADVPPPANPTATDNCGSVNIQYTQTTLADTCAGGPFYRIWTATDSYGNQTSFTQQLVLNGDQTPPQFNAWPTNGQTDCATFTTDYPVWLAQNMNTIQATDPSEPVVYSNDSPSNFNFSCDTSFVVTFTATDYCGNFSNVTATYHVLDTTPPWIVHIPVDTTVDCDQVPMALRLNNGLEVEDCDTNLIEVFSESSSQDTNVLSCSHYTYTIVRTWTIQDHCGNETSFQQIVSVQDTTPPVFATHPQDLSVPCYQVPEFIDLVATDACEAPVTIQKDETIHLGNCPANYERLRSWTAQDVCANQNIYTQTIHVFDTLAPTFVYVPGDTMVNCNQIPPLQNLIALDSCDSDVLVTPSETSTQNSDLTDCGHYNYTLTRTWLASDDCVNISTATQTIQVVDQDPPVILCPANITVATDSGSCEKTMLIPNPATYFDACTFAQATESISASAPITHPANTDANSTPVSVQLQLTTAQPTTSIAGNITLTIDLTNVDAEALGEFFKIYAEDSTLIGHTLPTPTQCGSNTTNLTNISTVQLSNWLADGTLELFLVSAGQGIDAINDICPGGLVTATLTYDFYEPNAPLTIQYALDNENPESWPNNIPSILPQGSHTVSYWAQDCSGNQDSCSFQIVVQDMESPSIQCPGDLVAYVTEDACHASVSLPYPGSFTDNCSLSNLFDFASDTTYIAFTNNGNAGTVPQAITYDISGVSANAISDAQIVVQFQGDNADAGEHFLVYGENNQLLGQTANGNFTQECQMPVATVLTISKDSVNSWASDGHILLQLIPETDAGVYANFIHPCGNLTPDLIDSSSTIQLTLQYASTSISYALPDTAGFVKAGNPIVLDLAPAEYPVTYTVTDGSGLQAMCHWTISVLDTIRPVALAQNAIVAVNPSGIDSSSIDPTIVNAGSYDNCEIVSMTLAPNTFSCDQAGQTLPIVLTVVDAAGNVGRDTANVLITNEQPAPTFTQGVCGNDTLFLSANPPSASANAYTYQWSGPNSFSSTSATPFIPSPTNNNVGSYSVTITGTSGCTSANTIQIQLNASPDAPQLTVNKPTICPGDPLVLSTQGFAGGDVHYLWYEGLPPNGNLLSTTNNNVFTIDFPPSGENNYYATVDIGGCVSVYSNVVNVNVSPDINLVVVHDSLEVCTGDEVHLGLTTAPVGIQYTWFGPHQFSANTPSAQFQADSLAQSGLYIISATKDGCVYQPDTTFVLIRTTPATPIVSTNSPICEDESLLLEVTNYANGTTLHWTKNGLDTLLQSNLLALEGKLSQAGYWTVSADDGYCQSPDVTTEIFVSPTPTVKIDSVGNVCLGQPMALSFSSNPTAETQSWSGPGSFSSPLANPVTPATPGLYRLTVKTGAGCSAKDSIFIHPKELPEITALSSTSDGCFDGEEIELIPTVFPANTNYEYHWSGPNSYNVCCDIAQPVISNASENINGYYSLQVVDEFGCTSQEKTIFISGQDKPARPVLTTATPSLCEGEAISLDISNSSVYPVDSVFVRWVTPKGLVDTAKYQFMKDVADSFDEGSYFAVISVNGCVSDTSSGLYLNIKPKPAKPFVSWNSPLCVGETLHLSTIPVSGAIYHWFGQDNIPGVSDPKISGVQLADAGNYAVQIEVDGCESEISDSVNVMIKPLPVKPVIDFTSPICLTGGQLDLSISPSTQAPGAQYTWITNPNDTIGATSFFTKYSTDNLSNYQDGSHQFYATVQQNGCVNVSDVITIEMDEMPSNNADAGVDANFCIDQQVSLHAEWPSVGKGMWRQVSGLTANITNPDTNLTTINGVSPNLTYGFEWSLSKGGCIAYSKDTVLVSVVTPELADAGSFIDTCLVSEVTLAATPPSSTGGHWLPSTQDGIKIVDKESANTPVTGLKPGHIYHFEWELDDAGCGVQVDTVRVRIASGPPSAGQDLSLCSLDSCVSLMAGNLGGEDDGEWSTYDSGAEILFPYSEETSACNLRQGVNPFVWTINNGACGSWSKDTVFINFAYTPVAQADTFDLEYGIRNVINICDNDQLYSEHTIEILNNPAHCKIVSMSQNGEILIAPNEDYVGEDVFTYQVCNNSCGECTEATVVLQIGAMKDCKVPTIFTPDGDGINDYLIIPCLLTNQYQESTLSVFNQWGDEIFYEKDYHNNWAGQYHGTPIPEGTYYYIFDLGNGQTPQRGFFVVKY